MFAMAGRDELNRIANQAVGDHMARQASIFMEAAIGNYIGIFGVDMTIKRLQDEIKFLEEFS